MAKELKSFFDGMEYEKITKIVASGNAVKRNPVLQKILKDTFGMEIFLTCNDEEAALGCALYAGISSSQIEMSHIKKIIKEKVNDE